MRHDDLPVLAPAAERPSPFVTLTEETFSVGLFL